MAGDTTLNGLLGQPAAGYAHAIYHAQAPEDATFPSVIFFKSSGVPTETYGSPDAFDNDVWTIKAVDENSTATVAEEVAGRLITLLDDASLSISGSVLAYLRRQSDIEYAELVEGVTYHHVGSLFRLVTTT
jgi:hypothetical protein